MTGAWLLPVVLLLVEGSWRSHRVEAPQLFAPGVISTRDYERDGAFSPDGQTFFFTKRTLWPYFSVICLSHLVNDRWSEPEIAPFSGRYPDATPTISPDGNTLYFASRRPDDTTASLRNNYDLFAMERTGNGWSAPRRLPVPINTEGNELSPSLTRSGTLYFVTDQGVPQVVRAAPTQSGWETPVPVAATADSGGYELGVAVSPDERFMVVSVLGRDDALTTAEGIYPRTDLYVRERRDGTWSSLRHLPAPINSGAEEGSPAFSPDGTRLVFTSERGGLTEHGNHARSTGEFESALHNPGNGLGDIYLVDVAALGLRP